jgi:tripartite-type tricarboxylate transporter receptor subunit TctC
VVYGSQGSGNTPHLTANMFMNMTGTSMVHVPYRGETLVYNDMLGGRVDVFFGNISGALALYRDGRLKVLAVTDKVRAAAIPEVPTTAEAGLPGLISGAWYGMVGPPRLKSELQEQIAKATIEVLQMPDVQQRLRALNIEPIGNSPAQMAAYVREDSQRWGEVIRKNNIVSE